MQHYFSDVITRIAKGAPNFEIFFAPEYLHKLSDLVIALVHPTAAFSSHFASASNIAICVSMNWSEIWKLFRKTTSIWK
jgi:hypothetical protein